MGAPFVWLARPLVAEVMDEWPAIGTKSAQGGHDNLDVIIDGDEPPVQQRYPLSPMLFLVSAKPFHVAAMR